MGGLARAAYNTGAIVIDGGLGSCVEKFCLRKNLKLVGVCPEAQISYPKLSEHHRMENELTNGHTHFIIVGKEDGKITYEWGQEGTMKFDFAKRITAGRGKGLGANTFPVQKIVTVVMGDNQQQSLRDIELSLNHKIPIIFVEGSTLCNEFIICLQDNAVDQDEQDSEATNGATKAELIQRIMLAAAKGKVTYTANDSEELAQVIHLLLTISV